MLILNKILGILKIAFIISIAIIISNLKRLKSE